MVQCHAVGVAATERGMSQSSERRRAPRIAKQLPLTLGHEAGDLVTKTENLSASGAYCTVKRYVAPMTKFKVQLQLPDFTGKAHVVSGEGVVVRVEPPAPSPTCRSYNIAIFFTWLSGRNQAQLTAYVNQHLTAV